jgi:hypothetical protein
MVQEFILLLLLLNLILNYFISSQIVVFEKRAHFSHIFKNQNRFIAHTLSLALIN